MRHAHDNTDSSSLFTVGVLARKKYRRGRDWYVDVCFLRESAAMHEYFEYDKELCCRGAGGSALPTRECGTALGCFARHPDPVQVRSLRPPSRFSLVDISPRESRAAAAAAALAAPPGATLTGAAGWRPTSRVLWRFPAGAKQEALAALANDRRDCIITD